MNRADVSALARSEALDEALPIVRPLHRTHPVGADVAPYIIIAPVGVPTMATEFASASPDVPMVATSVPPATTPIVSPDLR